MPVLGVVALVLTWGRGPADVAVVVVVGVLLAGAVLAAVHHAEVVAHRVGEPFGSLVLAVAVTVIEVALIVTLMVAGGDDTSTLARDTVFAAVMITCNGIVGLSLLVGTLRTAIASFNAGGHRRPRWPRSPRSRRSRLVLPTFTTSAPGAEFSLGAARVRGGRVARALRAVRGRPDRPPPRLLPAGRPPADDADEHADPPTTRDGAREPRAAGRRARRRRRAGQVESPAIEDGVEAAGAPHSAVGVVIALLVLLPETLAAVRNARRDRMQTSLNLALGSAMASIGLTIPAIAIALDLARRAARARPGCDADRPAGLTMVVSGADRPARAGRRSRRAACTSCCSPRSSSSRSTRSGRRHALAFGPAGEIAQLVEHTTENRGVPGSIPGLAISKAKISHGRRIFYSVVQRRLELRAPRVVVVTSAVLPVPPAWRAPTPGPQSHAARSRGFAVYLAGRRDPASGARRRNADFKRPGGRHDETAMH